MKKEYKILLYAFPFIIALSAFATVLAPPLPKQRNIVRQ